MVSQNIPRREFIMKNILTNEIFERNFGEINIYDNPSYEPGTGIDTHEGLQKALMSLEARLDGCSHQTVKAEAMRLTMHDGAIALTPKSPFGVNIVGWLPTRKVFPYRMFDGIKQKWTADTYDESDYARELRQTRLLHISTGTGWSYPDVDHTKPNFEDILKLGIPGLLARSEVYRAKKISDGTYSEQDKVFYDSVKTVYDAVIHLFNRFADLCDKYNTEFAPYIARALRSLATGAPTDLYEALLLTYLYQLIQEHLGGTQARSLGNVDMLWRPYYERDILQERLDRESAKVLIKYFYMQFQFQNHPNGQPIHFAGSMPDGSTCVSELSYVLLEAYGELNIVSPKVQIAIAENTPDEYIRAACDLLRTGHTSVVFCNEEVGKAAIRRYTDDEADINCPALSGCYNFSILDDAQPESAGFSLVKPVELAMNGGRDILTDKLVGFACTEPEDVITFEDFSALYKKQLTYIIDVITEIIDFYDERQLYLNPDPMLSACFDNSVREAKDFLYNGAKYHHSVVTMSCIASAVDSIWAVKKYVYDKKLLTLSEFRDILRANFEGHEDLLFTLKNDRVKFGNDIEDVDALAAEIMAFAADYIYSKKNTLGYRYARDSEGITRGIAYGQKSSASPDGRLAGEPFSKNLLPVFGMDRNGLTAYFNSVTKIDAVKLGNGAPIDFALHPTVVEGDNGLDIMLSIIRTVFAKGGSALQGNIYDTETLKAAQREPEKYEGLQVRLCGWSQYFNRLTKDEQDILIMQSQTNEL